MKLNPSTPAAEGDKRDSVPCMKPFTAPDKLVRNSSIYEYPNVFLQFPLPRDLKLVNDVFDCSSRIRGKIYLDFPLLTGIFLHDGDEPDLHTHGLLIHDSSNVLNKLMNFFRGLEKTIDLLRCIVMPGR